MPSNFLKWSSLFEMVARQQKLGCIFHIVQFFFLQFILLYYGYKLLKICILSLKWGFVTKTKKSYCCKLEF